MFAKNTVQTIGTFSLLFKTASTRKFSSCFVRYNNDSDSNANSPPSLTSNPLKELKKLNIRIPKSNNMPSRPTIPESDIQEKFIKGGSGKGGQKINKTNSKVQLTHIATGLVVTSQATRSRDQNRKIARQILAMKIEEMDKGVESRKQIVIARKQMLKQRAKKKTRAKYKKLNEQDSVGKDDNTEQEEEEGVIIIVDDEEISGSPKK